MIGIAAGNAHQYDPMVGLFLLIAAAGGAAYGVYRFLAAPEAEPASPNGDAEGGDAGSGSKPRGDRPKDNSANRSNQRRQRSHTGQDQTEDASGPSASTVDQCYAEILGLKGRVTRDQITHRYKTLAAQYHPDTVYNRGPKIRALAEAEMKAINEAYEYFREKYSLP